MKITPMKEFIDNQQLLSDLYEPVLQRYKNFRKEYCELQNQKNQLLSRMPKTPQQVQRLKSDINKYKKDLAQKNIQIQLIQRQIKLIKQTVENQSKTEHLTIIAYYLIWIVIVILAQYIWAYFSDMITMSSVAVSIQNCFQESSTFIDDQSNEQYVQTYKNMEIDQNRDSIQNNRDDKFGNKNYRQKIYRKNKTIYQEAIRYTNQFLQVVL